MRRPNSTKVSCGHHFHLPNATNEDRRNTGEAKIKHPSCLDASNSGVEICPVALSCRGSLPKITRKGRESEYGGTCEHVTSSIESISQHRVS